MIEAICRGVLDCRLRGDDSGVRRYFHVIASAAKQSISRRKERMDYFASLAMMGWTAPDGIYVPDW
jgi:hypothetical protein